MDDMTAAVVSLAIDKVILAAMSFACGWLWRSGRCKMTEKKVSP